MGRTSKLTEKQWQDIERRLVNGETARSLGREFGVAESAIRKRFGNQIGKIKEVAGQLVAAETAFKALPISAQISARTLADRMMAVSNHLMSAAEFNAATAHRLSAIAHEQVQKVDDAEPERSAEALQRIAVLTKMANTSSEIGLNLLAANKDLLKQGGAPGGVMLKIIRAKADA